MISLRKLLLCGVADKYGENQFHIPDESRLRDLKASQQLEKELNKPIVFVDDADNKPNAIYKNPKNLHNFDAYVRAIADRFGNLYIAIKDGNFAHDDMINELKPEIKCNLSQKDKYISLHRDNKTNGFYLATTHRVYLDDLVFDDDILGLQDLIALVAVIQKKNPQYSFKECTAEINDSIKLVQSK